ncbi:MAG: hypothetical protein ACXWP5_08280 [Bdellovibrionota bacterium]
MKAVQKVQLDRQAIIFHEQQALHRLKQILLHAPPPRRWWRGVQILAQALFRRAELVREVAPGQRGIPQREWREEQLLRQL